MDNILFLKNIKKDDYIELEKIIYNEMKESMEINNVNNIDFVIYNKIPKTYNNNEEWVKTTNLKCWFCSLDFTGIPYFIPKKYYNTKHGKEMEVYGNFCKIGCAKGFLDSDSSFLKNDSYWQSNELLKLLYKKRTGKIIDIITPSISKFNLKQYGSEMDLKEFKHKLELIDKINNE